MHFDLNILGIPEFVGRRYDDIIEYLSLKRNARRGRNDEIDTLCRKETFD